MTVWHHRCSVGGERLVCDRTMCIWETWAALGGDPGVKDYLDCAPEVLGLNSAVGVAVRAVTSLVMVGPDCRRLSVGTHRLCWMQTDPLPSRTHARLFSPRTHTAPHNRSGRRQTVWLQVSTRTLGDSFCRRAEMRGIYLHTHSSMSLELSYLYRGPQR